MNKKIITLLLLLVLSVCLQAQISFTLQVLPVGVVQKTQLWNMVVVNTSDNPIMVYINLNLQSARDNRTLMTAFTKQILISKGAKQITASDLSPIQYNYLSAGFNIDLSPDGFLPIGNYKACYAIYKSGGESVTPLAEDCMPIEVQPLSPPILNTPADTTAIETIYPQFTWLPAVPMNLFSDLNYDLLLVEVLAGQTSGDAIQKNTPVYNISNCKTPFLNYPGSAKSLDTGRVYAWKVVAKNGDDPVAQTDIWTFSVSNKVADKKEGALSNYIVLKNELDAIYMSRSDSIHVKYFSFDVTHQAAVQFIDASGQIVRSENREVRQGDNFFDFPLGNRFSKDKVYQVVITSLDNKKNTARFSISKYQ